MPFVLPEQIEPGDTSDAASDGALLDDVAALVLDGSNLRTESVALPHLAAARNTTPASADLPITSWIDSIAVTLGTSTHGDASPGTVVSPGGTDIELTPIAGARGTLREGDVLRWHFDAVVDTVDDVVPDDDLYTFYLEITGTDDNGAAVVTSLTEPELGIPANYSMNPAKQPAGGDAAGSNFEIEVQRVSFSGILIHREADAVFSANGGNVHIDLIRVLCYVGNAANAVVVSSAKLTALICKG